MPAQAGIFFFAGRFDGNGKEMTAVGDGAAHGRHCPHCGSDRVQHWGSSHGLPRYRCIACKRTFNPLTGTSLARLRSKDKWFLFLRALTQKKSIRKSAELCGIDNSTALRWRQRFLACTEAEKRSIMMALMESFPGSLQHLQEGMLDPAGELLLTLMRWMS
jgi:transposase-like protein